MSVHIEKKCFVSPNQTTFMMLKTRSVVKMETKELNINVYDADGRVLMNSEWPWKGLWCLFENEVNKMKQNSEEQTKQTLKGYQTKNKTVLTKDWELGSDYKNKSAKSKANCAVLSMLEKRSNKEIIKTDTIMQAVSLDPKSSGIGIVDAPVDADVTNEIMSSVASIIS